MAETDKIEIESSESKQTKEKIKTCGIVMPISAMPPDYTAEHWARVQKILWKSVEKANMKPILVWENPSVDVIQNTILQNIYESDLVICDVSGLNPNVMLETGLRLSTKKPTVIVTDRVIKPPFDIQSIGHLPYQRDLEFNAIETFIMDLSQKLLDISKAEDNGTYVPFAEKFEIKTVMPKAVSVTSEDFILESIKSINKFMSKLEKDIYYLTKGNDKINPAHETNQFRIRVYVITVIDKYNVLDIDLFREHIPTNLRKEIEPFRIQQESPNKFSIKILMDPEILENSLIDYLYRLYPKSEISYGYSYEFV